MCDVNCTILCTPAEHKLKKRENLLHGFQMYCEQQRDTSIYNANKTDTERMRI